MEAKGGAPWRPRIAGYHPICWCPGGVLYCRSKETDKTMFSIPRSKSFKEGGETFFLVALVNDVAQDVTEGLCGDRHM